MHPFLELLVRLGLIGADDAEALVPVVAADTDEETNARILTELGDDVLQDVADALHDVSDAVLDLAPEDQTDEHVEIMGTVAEVLRDIGSEQETRQATAQERSDEISRLAGEIGGTPDDDTDDSETEVEDEVDVEIEATDDDTDTDEGGDEGGETSDGPEATDDTGDGAEVESEELEPVTASSPKLSRVAARRPRLNNPVPTGPSTFEVSDDISSWGLVAAANAPGTPHGKLIETEEELCDAFNDAIAAAAGYNGDDIELVRLFQSKSKLREIYDGAHTLDRGDSVGNSAKITQAQEAAQALVASDGNPAPEENRYDIPVVGIEARPLRDRFCTKMGVPRGGVRVLTPPRLAAVSGGVTTHTDANDIAAASKASVTVTAGAEVTQLVDAVVKRVKYGEFMDRFLPELVQAWMKLLGVEFARHADQKILTDVAAAGTNIVAGDDLLSATRDMFSQIDRLAIVVRSRERLGENFAFQLALPEWVHGLMRVDVSRQQPGGGTTTDETLALADATIDRYFTVRNIRPVWSPDMQVFSEQGVGALQGFPDTVVGHMSPPGAHVFLDGGQLNLGVVRDSALYDTNDIEAFSETFEQHIYHHQVPPYQLTMDVDPSGATSLPIAFDPSVTGS